MKIANGLAVWGMIALVYHLAPWRLDHAGGERFAEMMDVSVANWSEEVIGASKPVLVFFHSSHSSACQQLYPVISGVHESYRGKLKVARVDLDSNASLAMQHRIEGVPTLMLFRDGLLAETLDGEVSGSFNALKEKLVAYCVRGAALSRAERNVTGKRDRSPIVAGAAVALWVSRFRTVQPPNKGCKSERRLLPVMTPVPAPRLPTERCFNFTPESDRRVSMAAGV